MAVQKDIFIAFFRSSILGFGGGPAAIPLVHKEVVEIFKWMDDKEFGDVLALGNALPGPINTKMAGYIGYKVGGYIGMINAVFASTIPTIVLMVLLLTTLNAYKDEPWVAGMARGVVPVAGVMMVTLTWQFLTNAQKDLGSLKNGLLVITSLLLIVFLNLHPGIVIGVILAYALFKPTKNNTASSKE